MSVTFKRIKAREYEASTGEKIYYYERNEKGEHAAGWYVGATPTLENVYMKLNHAKTAIEAREVLAKAG